MVEEPYRWVLLVFFEGDWNRRVLATTVVVERMGLRITGEAVGHPHVFAIVLAEEHADDSFPGSFGGAPVVVCY